MKSLCLNRINKDLKEITKSPLEGIGIVSLENDPKKYIVNIRIMSGVYEGYCVQLLLTFPDNYPIHPPKILIYPGQSLDNTYHHHIYVSDLKDEKGRHFQKFCFDLLENDFLPTSTQYSGWNPSYTTSSFLLQVQDFLSKPDFPTGYIPPPEKINELMKSMDNYEKSFKIKSGDNNEEISKVHTWKNPYPEMHFKNASSDLEKVVIEENISFKNINKIKEIKENLTCFISRLNYIDNRNILLGYPIQRKNNSLIPIPEILSYEGFLQEISQIDEINEMRNPNHSFFFNDNVTSLLNHRIFNELVDLISSNNNHINPIFNLGRRNLFFNLFNRLNNFDDLNPLNNNDKYKFKSANNEFYNCWLPIYINEEHFQKNETTILNYFSIIKFGNSGLKKYDFHPQYIFEVMPNILGEMIKKMATKKISSSFMKCFFQYILMYKKLEKKYNNILCKYQIFYLEKHLKNILKSDEKIDIIKESLELLILFFYCDNEVNPEIKERIEIYIHKLEKIIFFEFFEKIAQEKQNIFLEDLKMKGLFNKIADIIFINSYFSLLNKEDLILCEILRNEIINQMNRNFFKLYKELNSDIKQKINNLLINKINFANYFANLDSSKFLLLKSKKNRNYYNILQLFHFLKAKILNKNFLEQLEKDLGIFIDTEQYIKEINMIKNHHYLITWNINKVLNENNYYYGIDDLIFLQVYRENIEPKNFYDYFTYTKENYFDSLNYPFIKIYKVGDFEDKIIPYKIRHIIEEEKNICKKLSIKSFFKTDYMNRKRKDEIKKNRINIKNSYDKNYNKGFHKYFKKNIRSNKQLLNYNNKYKKK